MSPVCFACQHANPPDAKFCNECGCPCSLKPCPQCDAINDAGADQCQRCGVNFRDASLRATAEFEVVRATESSREEVVKAGKAGERFTTDALSVNDLGTSTFADLTLPPDIAESANVDFLLFPTSEVRELESRRLRNPAAVALPPDDAGANNVDFSLFPTSRASNSAIEEKEIDALPTEPASARSRRRPTILALALLSIVCVAGFYGARYGLPFDESPDRLSQGAMTIGASAINSSSPSSATSNEPAKLVPGAEGEVDVTAANDSLHTLTDAMKPDPTSMVQRGIANERSAISQRVSEPSRQRPEGCADSVAALGLCNVTSGR